jgi:periplasmic protein CpxP/Spy
MIFGECGRHAPATPLDAPGILARGGVYRFWGEGRILRGRRFFRETPFADGSSNFREGWDIGFEEMNVYKRFLAITGSAILILGLGLATAQAQDQNTPPPDNAPQGPPPQGRGMRGGPMSTDQMLARMDERLHLSDDQKGKIRTILEDRQAAMEKLRSDSTVSPDDRRAKMRSIFEDHNNQIKNVLNDEQKQQFDQMMQRRGRMGNGGGNPPPPPPDSQAQPPNPQL